MKSLIVFSQVLIFALISHTIQAQEIIGYSSLFIFDTKAPIVSLIQPNGGQSINANQTLIVSWLASDEQIISTPISIGQSTTENGNYQFIANGLVNSGSVAVMPLTASSDYCRIQVSAKDAFGNIGHDESDNYFSSSSNINLWNGLVAHFPFNNNFLDYSENSFNGTQSGGVSFTQDHWLNPNGAASFDGQNDQINIIPTGDLLNYCAGDHSYSVWMKLNSVPTVPKFVVDASGVGAGGDQRGIRFMSNSYPGFKWVTTTGSYTVYSNVSLSTGIWYHITGKLEGSTGKIFVNGIEKGSITSTGTPTSIFNFKIGNIASGGTGNGFFNGDIDELRIYNRALSSAEIQSLYQNNIPLSPLSAAFTVSNQTPLVGQYIQFTDQSTGNPAPDSWMWNFGDGTTDSVQNPSHVYQKAGCFSVSLTIGNGTGEYKTVTDYGYTATRSGSCYMNSISNNKGIELEIIETGGTQEVTHVGYKGSSLEYFPVESVEGNKRMAHITFFENTANHGMEENTIYLYHQNGIQHIQIGHIFYQYDPSIEKEFPRCAYIFFHNDNSVTNNNLNFPYSLTTPGYDLRWKYYKLGEFPVSMLIPSKNEFKTEYIKQPLLFIHGWEGTYSYEKNPDCSPSDNEVSYWYTTVKKFWDDQTFDDWQYYYPYNTDIKSISQCLRKALFYLRNNIYSMQKKVDIVTHSMGSLPTMQFIHHYPAEAQSYLNKVLFLGPPLHGSYGANIYYRYKDFPDTRILGNYLEKFLGYDSEAPAVRDMKLVSDLTWEINNNSWPDLNSSGGIEDDYFVILGTTPRFYLSDGPFKPFSEYPYPASVVFHSSRNHHDGIVSMSSGSLLDHGIGFATIHGNHNDLVHGQSKNSLNENIGSSNLIPEIIRNYFNSCNLPTFTQSLKDHQPSTDIRAIISYDGTVLKPIATGINLGNINSSNYFYSTGEDDVNYQKGEVAFETINFCGLEKYFVYLDPLNKILKLFPTNPSNSYPIGFFKKNKTNQLNIDRYYFENLLGFYSGSALNMESGEYTIKMMNDNNIPIDGLSKKLDFNYCQTTYITLGSFNKIINDEYNNQTNSKISNIYLPNQPLCDSLPTVFYVDTEAEKAKFGIYNDNGCPLNIKFKLPNGTIVDSSFVGGIYSKDNISGLYKMEVNYPMLGKWEVWAESNQTGADTMIYSVVTHLRSDIYAYLLNDSTRANIGNNFEIVAGLQMDTLSLADSLVFKAEVTKPNGDKLLFDISSSATAIDSAFKFSYPYLVDTIGYHAIKLYLDGVYNNHRFERVLFHQFEALDTTNYLNIPDVLLKQYSESAIIDLRNFAFNYDLPYDSLSFTSTVLSSNLDPAGFSSYLNDTIWTNSFYTSLADTGTAVIQFTMHLPNNNIVRDTIQVNVVMPDILITNENINLSSVYQDSSLVATCQILNHGNSYANSFKLKYYLSIDSIVDQSDVCIKERIIGFLENDSLLNIIDTISIPSLTTPGTWKLIFNTDAGNVIKEVNDSTNNTANLPINIQQHTTLNVRLFPEGLYNSTLANLNKTHDENGDRYPGSIADNVTISLANSLPPYSIIKTFDSVNLGTNGLGSVIIPPDITGSYYIIVKHRNSIETWSAFPVLLNATSVNYDFTSAITAAYGDNLKSISGRTCIFSGDVNQDGAIDTADMTPVDNDSALYVSGYLVTDITGDGIVDTADMTIIDNNSYGYVGVITP